MFGSLAVTPAAGTELCLLAATGANSVSLTWFALTTSAGGFPLAGSFAVKPNNDRTRDERTSRIASV